MSSALVWFRQDLRLTDNPAFFEACANHDRVIPVYILDEKNSVLGQAQAWWLHHSLKALDDSLADQLGLTLILRKGNPLDIILDLVSTLGIDTIYWNRCYEPQTIERDKNIKKALQESGIDVFSFNGSLLNKPWTIHNKSGDFFKVFTPYWKTCRQTLNTQATQSVSHKPVSAIDVTSDDLHQWNLLPHLNWASEFPNYWTPGAIGAQQKLDKFITDHLHGYKTNCDFPEKRATSYLSPHLHFGEISPWTILRAVEYAKLDPFCDLAGAEHFLSELGWREFSYYLLYHVPTLPYQNFKNEFDIFPWHNDEVLLKKWQKGMTGYPIVDAGMRELWATGYIHNRVRMIIASFLTKGLFIDWRLGADWFLDTLVDADLANNSAGWQWVAGCGADAAPYFRIFNPVLQSQKFDSNGDYIRRWVPELSSLNKDVIHAPWESTEMENYLSLATHLLISIPPTSTMSDIVLIKYGDLIKKQAPYIKWVGYLSSTGIYGDHQGNWVNEDSACIPHTSTGIARLKAEQAWLSFSQKHQLPLHLFRLSGIYGPGRNVFERLIRGKKQSIFKENQVFCRIHVDDIVATLLASIQSPNPLSIYNVSDDEPAPAHVVDLYATNLLHQEPLPLIPFFEAHLSPMEQEFYENNRRVSNIKIKAELHVALNYPTYKEGLTQIWRTDFAPQ